MLPLPLGGQAGREGCNCLTSPGSGWDCWRVWAEPGAGLEDPGGSLPGHSVPKSVVPPEHSRTSVVSFSFSELYFKPILGAQSTEEGVSVQLPMASRRASVALMDVLKQDRAPNTSLSPEINCLAVGCLYVVIGMFLHLKLPEGLYKYSAHKYNYSRALARNSHLLWDIAVSSPY